MKKPTILKPEEANRMTYPLPKSLVNAAGMLKGKLSNGVKYQQAIRRDWEVRAKKLAQKSRIKKS